MIIVDEPTSPARMMSSSHENEDSYSSLDIDEALEEVMKEERMDSELELLPLQSEIPSDFGYNEVVCKDFESPLKEMGLSITENGRPNDMKENGEGIDQAIERVTMLKQNLHSEREPSLEYTILTEKNYQPSEFEKQVEKDTLISNEKKYDATNNIHDQEVQSVQTELLIEGSVYQISEKVSSEMECVHEYTPGNRTNEDKTAEEITKESCPGNVMTEGQVLGITENSYVIDLDNEGLTLEFSKPRPLVTDFPKGEMKNDDVKADEVRETHETPKETKIPENMLENLVDAAENVSQITDGSEDAERVISEDSSETEETTPSTGNENERLPVAEEERSNMQQPNEDVGSTEKSEQMHSTLQQVLGGTSIRRDIEAETDSLMPGEDGSERGERERGGEIGEMEGRSDRGGEMEETEGTSESGSELEMERGGRERERTGERAAIRDNKEPEPLLRPSSNPLVNASESLLTREDEVEEEEAGAEGRGGRGEGAATEGELALNKKSFGDLHTSGDVAKPRAHPPPPLLMGKTAKKVRFPDDGNLATHYTPEAADVEEGGEEREEEEEKEGGKERKEEEEQGREEKEGERVGLVTRGARDVLSEEDFIHFCFLASALSIFMYFITIWFA